MKCVVDIVDVGTSVLRANYYQKIERNGKLPHKSTSVRKKHPCFSHHDVVHHYSAQFTSINGGALDDAFLVSLLKRCFHREAFCWSLLVSNLGGPPNLFSKEKTDVYVPLT